MKRLALSLLLALFLSSCGGNNPSTEEATSSEEPVITSSEDTSTSGHEEDYYSHTITFKGSSRTGTIDDKSASSYCSYFNGNTELFTSLTAVGYIQINEFTDNFITLSFGSQKSAGSLLFKSNHVLKKVEFKVQGYFKKYSGGMNVDSNPTFVANSTNYSILETEEDGTPKEILITKELNAKELLIGNLEEKQRVFLNEMTVYYI